MISFRFHIVSLTAVLLALGIGLVLGTTFLDDATVNTLENQLSDVPVLLVATRGVDDDRVDEVTRAFGQADANLLGTWWLTDKLALDDDNQVSDLGNALQLSTDDVERLRSNLAG